MSTLNQETGINKFANDYSMDKKKLKMKSINTYNICQYTCYFSKTPNDSEHCSKLCEQGIFFKLILRRHHITSRIRL